MAARDGRLAHPGALGKGKTAGEMVDIPGSSVIIYDYMINDINGGFLKITVAPSSWMVYNGTCYGGTPIYGNLQMIDSMQSNFLTMGCLALTSAVVSVVICLCFKNQILVQPKPLLQCVFRKLELFDLLGTG